jgi:hypothetical protein
MGGGEPNVRALYESLNLSLGPAYDTSDLSNVTAETMAEARALDAVYSANRRMALQWDPRRMTDFMSRWETIFGLHPGRNDTIPERRAILDAKFLALIGPATLEDTVVPLLGDSFVEVIRTTLAEAYQRWPENGFPNDWVSHTAHILIRVQYAANQTESAFLKLMATLGRVLDDLLPSWCDWEWGTFDEGGIEGFFLDEPIGLGPPPYNLNYETFDVNLSGRASFRITIAGATSPTAVARFTITTSGLAKGTGKAAGTGTIGMTTTGTATAHA